MNRAIAAALLCAASGCPKSVCPPSAQIEAAVTKFTLPGSRRLVVGTPDSIGCNTAADTHLLAWHANGSIFVAAHDGGMLAVERFSVRAPRGPIAMSAEGAFSTGEFPADGGISISGAGISKRWALPTPNAAILARPDEVIGVTSTPVDGSQRAIVWLHTLISGRTTVLAQEDGPVSNLALGPGGELCWRGDGVFSEDFEDKRHGGMIACVQLGTAGAIRRTPAISGSGLVFDFGHLVWVRGNYVYTIDTQFMNLTELRYFGASDVSPLELVATRVGLFVAVQHDGLSGLVWVPRTFRGMMDAVDIVTTAAGEQICGLSASNDTLFWVRRDSGGSSLWAIDLDALPKK